VSYRSARLLAASVLVAVLALAGRGDAATPELPPNMKTVYLVLLKKGPTWTPEVTDAVKALQEAHLANIRRLWTEHKMVVAGPTEDPTDTLRGIFVFEAASLDEAKALAASDPAIKAGRLAADIYPWWVEKGALPEAGSSCTPPAAK
jgi:uncharacterized protein YciI